MSEPPAPAVLGRGVVITSGAPVPPAWERTPRVLVDEAVLAGPGLATAALHEAWARRRPVVVVLAVDASRFRRSQPVDVPVWSLTPAFEPGEDRLQFLVWANNYDARSGDLVWWWATKASRLGAELPPPDATGPGDVILPDGRRAWVDGGPRGAEPAGAVDGAVVVHRESVERGRLGAVEVAPRPTVDLAPDQLAAVVHPSGPARVIAPAGSGKTRVLTERLRHLLADRAWEPETVLAVAYNKRAQEELQARTAGLSARTRTLNGLGLHLLSRWQGRAPAVLGERDVRRLVERLAPRTRRRANTDPLGPYLEALGTVRLGLVDPEVVEGERDDVPGLAGLFEPFRAELAAIGAVDFDDQIYGAIEALLRDPEFRSDAQAAHRHLLVDEFQDLTPAHVLLLRLLALPALDVFGVGDDDQVIYGHAGADPGFLIDYDRLFPAAGAHPLQVNYRCRPAVVSAAGHLLGYNDRRVAKIIRPGRQDPGNDAPAALTVTTHPGDEGAAVLVTNVRAWLDAGHPTTSVAVLSRVNALLLAPQVALQEAGIVIRSALGPEVLERTGLRAALAYLRLAVAPDSGLDPHDVIEILRRPSRGLPPWFTDRVRQRRAWSVDALAGVARRVPEKDASKVDALVADLMTIRRSARRGMAAAELLVVIRDGIGLGGAMSLLDSSRGGEGSSHLDDLEALEQVAGLHPDPATFESWLRDSVARPTDASGVTLSTVHRVKGMEWEAVFVYGATAGIVPHRLADDIEEERRVLHVAITRGRERVVLLGDQRRPSPFLAELDGRAPRAAAASAAPTAGGPGSAGPGDRTAASSRRPRTPPGAVLPVAPGDAALEEALRTWRRQRARSDQVPAFIVCSDRTLRAIAVARPSSLVALRQIEGIGPTKLDAYGDELLAVVTAART